MRAMCLFREPLEHMEPRVGTAPWPRSPGSLEHIARVGSSSSSLEQFVGSDTTEFLHV